ncbi:MAG: hypothetical protein EOM26_09255 [Alphaproteobacteria bacterium]|nr:hypothetical protein [Alphaproteobacteria bacterium]
MIRFTGKRRESDVRSLIYCLFALPFFALPPGLSCAQDAASTPTEAPKPSSPTASSTVEPFPLEDKFYNNRFVMSWAFRNGLSVMSMTFVNVDDRLDRNRRLFTKAGFARFMGDLEEAGMIDLIKNEKLTISVGQTGHPEIIEEGVVDGRYRWIIQMPIYMNLSRMDMKTFKSSRVTDHMLLTMIVVRSNEPHLQDAIGFETWVTELKPSPW